MIPHNKNGVWFYCHWGENQKLPHQTQSHPNKENSCVKGIRCWIHFGILLKHRIIQHNIFLLNKTSSKLKFNLDLQCLKYSLKRNITAFVKISLLLKKWWTVRWGLLCAVYGLVYYCIKSIFKSVLPGKKSWMKPKKLSRDREGKESIHKY